MDESDVWAGVDEFVVGVGGPTLCVAESVELRNWKPDFDIDTIGQNPGGDGIIIFVGLAPRPRQAH